MLQKMTRTNEKGFTLIELMIVIAIIGILAAIAIPNFMSYRNKAFCSAVETDANSIAAAIADYFAMPSHITVPAFADLNNGAGLKLSGPTATINTAVVGGTLPAISITVTDGSSRCPLDYQKANLIAVSPNKYWSNATPGVYTKLIN